MSASEVAPNPFWYAKPTAALSSRDRLSIRVLAMFALKLVIQLSMRGIGKPVKPPACFRPAAVLDPDSRGVAAEVASEWLVLCSLVGRCSISVREGSKTRVFLRYTDGLIRPAFSGVVAAHSSIFPSTAACQVDRSLE